MYILMYKKRKSEFYHRERKLKICACGAGRRAAADVMCYSLQIRSAPSPPAPWGFDILYHIYTSGIALQEETVNRILKAFSAFLKPELTK